MTPELHVPAPRIASASRRTASFATSVSALHAVAAYVVAPARHRATGHIGLVPTTTGFATPPLPDGAVVGVEGVEFVRADGKRRLLTTLREVAAFARVDLDPRPPVGADLPPFRPDAPLHPDRADVAALAKWWSLGATVLDHLRRSPGVELSGATLWPEHFDLGAVGVLPGGIRVNVGFSPGDGFVAGPYAYVGPQDRDGADRSWWNTPFGAACSADVLLATADPASAALGFLRDGIDRITGQSPWEPAGTTRPDLLHDLPTVR